MWDLIVSVPDHCLSFYFSFQTFVFFQTIIYVRDWVDMILSRTVDQSSRFFLWKSQPGVGVESRRKITHIFELFDLFCACCYIRVYNLAK